MADNTQQQANETIATDDIGGVKYQRVKVTHGADGSSTDVSAASPFPTDLPDRTLLYQLLSTNGDGTGTINANGDYSSGATQFYIAPPASTVYKINRLLVSIEDGSGFRAERYASLAGALSNGISIEKQDNIGTTLIALDAGAVVTTNANWGTHCFDVDLKTWGAGDELLLARWTFDRAGGPLVLDGDNNERLTLVLNDNFTGIVLHQFLAQGYVE